jgi:hypothetical protein
MGKEWKWLAYAVAAVGLLTTGLLILLFVPRLGWIGLHEHAGGHCACCGGTGVLNPWGLLATTMIVLLMMSIPLSHIAVLVLATQSIARSEKIPKGVRHHGHAGEDDRSPDGAADQGAPVAPYAPARVGLHR